MGPPVLIKNRYEVKDVLGRGGMGVVYRAMDLLMRREVAVKTLRDAANSAFADLFNRECSVLSAMVHPNIVEIFDMGEFEEDGVQKPYFVMPLLPGKTLNDLVYPNNRPSDRPLPVEQCTDIISQACRGLHAAHECGLLHRDIKPRNIFVMRDNAVKLIDFGVVRLLGQQTAGTAGTLGTLHYMAPEQIALKTLTARSDIFSLATVCYEAMTGVHPFIRENDAETAAAVAEHTPAPLSALNPMVNQALAQAVAQAMEKDPRHRFESAAAFADALQRGLRNEKTGAPLLTNPQNRLARAQRSFARGDYEFTQEIVEQLAAEGIDGPEVQRLRVELAEAVRKRQAEVQLTTARRYFEEEEYVLAQRRVSEILESNASHQPALALKKQIEEKLNNLQVADSLKRAAAHLDNGAFQDARRLIEDSLALQPGNEEARRLLTEAGERALDWPRQRKEQEGLFQSAQSAYFEGRFDKSLQSLEQLAELTKTSKAAGERAAEYKNFYKRVRGDYDALQAMLADARKLLANGDLESAYLLSERLREQCAQDPDVRTLSKDIAARREAKEEEYRRGIARSIASEPDLSSRLHILNQAARSRPNDEYFHEERQKLQAQLQRVTELVQRAQVYEASGQYEYAIEEWLCVGDFYPVYPGLQEQLKRLKGIWEAARQTAKGELSAAVTEALKAGDQPRAGELLAAAESEFQGDAEYVALKTLFESTAEAHRQVDSLLSRTVKAESERRFGDIPALAQSVAALSQNIEPLRVKSFATLSASAARLVGSDWRVAELVAKEAAKIGTVPDGLHGSIAQQRREEEVTSLLGAERNSQSNLDTYRERVAEMLRQYPDETRLEERLRLVDATLADQRRQNAKNACAAEITLLLQELGHATDHRRLWDTYIRAKTLAGAFADDPEIAQRLEEIREQGAQFEEAADALTRDRIWDCYALCDGMLARRPGHFLFQKLRAQADARHRQLGEEYLARVERWLASEPDVYQRESILKKAQEEYPFEKRYAEELLNLEREKAVAESFAAKGRDFEKRGQTAEALAQWRQLRNVYAAYPGLEQSITRCEAIIDRVQRKARAQSLVTQGEFRLADEHFAEGYQMLREAAEVSDEIPDLLRQAAPLLLAGARNALPASPRLAESMVDLAQRLDDDLHVPKDISAKIHEARKAEDLTECLTAIQTHREAKELAGAVAVAEKFLEKYPGVKPVESARARMAAELEEQRKQQARAQTLEDLGAMELRAADLGPKALTRLREDLQEAAHLYRDDKEINQRVATLDSFFSALAEVRGLLQEHAPERVDEACARAMLKFPGHPLFKEALAESEQLKAEAVALEIERVKQRLEAESDFSKQAALVREALARFPDHADFLDRKATINAKQSALNERMINARLLEAKRLFGEAIKEWEAIGSEYPWLAAVSGEVERLAEARRKEKSGAADRWLRQVEEAIETCDYDNAATMLRQAAQQQPDRKLQGLEAKLTEGLKKKHESDAKLDDGRTRLADGDLEGGGKALYQAFELQPKDKEKTSAILLLLLGQIRAHMISEPAICESLLVHLKNIRPDQALPPDIKEALGKKAPGAKAKPVVSAKRIEPNPPAFAATSATGDNAAKDARQTYKPASEDLSFGKIAAALLILACLADAVFLVGPPTNRGVPVQISVTPDHAMIDLDGQVCVMPDCKFNVLKPGSHLVKFRKDGYKGKDAVVTVKETDSTPLNLTAALEPLPASAASGTTLALVPVAHSSAGGSGAQAKIQIRGALPGTRVRVDGSQIGEVTQDGTFTFAVPPGPHTVDLSLDGFSDRTIKRNFVRGESVSLAKDDVQLEPRQPEVRR